MSTTVKGKAGERLAARYLAKKGFRIINTNFRYGRGEVDIIAICEASVVFVEVKTWDAYDYGNLELSVDKGKKRRIIMASRGFLNQHPRYDGWRVRYDLLFISDAGKQVKHITSAFMETDVL